VSRFTMQHKLLPSLPILHVVLTAGTIVNKSTLFTRALRGITSNVNLTCDSSLALAVLLDNVVFQTVVSASVS